MEGIQKGAVDHHAGKRMKRWAGVYRGTEEEEWGTPGMMRGLWESEVVKGVLLCGT